uniref:Growth-regulating factor n=1 Tax=Salix viminalis TaxID=40686 RepID=A0A6N2KRT6_SALVM
MDLCKDVRDKNSSGSRSRSRSRRGAVIIRADSLSTSGREEVAAGLCITAISFSIHSQKKILQAIESEKIPFKTISPTSAITRNRFPFTSTQWQELEHQALIYKYMASGVPVPPELLYAVKRSLESSLASRLFPHQPSGFRQKSRPRARKVQKNGWKKMEVLKRSIPRLKIL